MLSVLLVGPTVPPIGGMAISQDILIQELSSIDDLEVTVVSTGIGRKGLTVLFGGIQLIWEIIKGSNRSDVLTAYIATTGISSLGLLMLIMSRVFKKPLMIRKAASSTLSTLGPVRRVVSEYVVGKSDLYLVQTLKLQEEAIKTGVTNVRWFPTNRPMASVSARPCPDRRKFVFVGHVRRGKGILNLVESIARSKTAICVDIYGPLFDDIPHELLEEEGVCYRGQLKREQVIPALCEYSALILPTLERSEGYPGVVFEAYAANIPVIASHIGGIPEIVDQTTGILVDPGDSNQLKQAMERMCVEEVRQRCVEGLQAKRVKFDSTEWSFKFYEYCREIYGKNNPESP